MARHMYRQKIGLLAPLRKKPVLEKSTFQRLSPPIDRPRRKMPQLGIAPQGLPFLRRRAILGHRGLHERLERARVDLLPFVDVDRLLTAPHTRWDRSFDGFRPLMPLGASLAPS